MNINATLIVQIITFALFIWFTMKFVWTPLSKVMDDRNKTIADGLAAADKGQQAEADARTAAEAEIARAKEQAAEILNKAEKRKNEIIDEAKDDAKTEAERIRTAAEAEIEQEVNRAREQLRGQVASIVLAGASKVLEKEIDESAHADLVGQLVKEI